MKKLSKQRRWQLKQIAMGKCQQCGEPVNHYPTNCDSCSLRHRNALRKGRGARRRYITRLDRQP